MKESRSPTAGETGRAFPAHPTLLIGRERELEAAKAKMLQAEVRLLTVTGPGGTGKTRLALAIAAELVDEFSDGVSFVDLSALHEPDLVAVTLLRNLRISELGEGAPLEILVRALHSRHQLLLIDNFEQLLPAAHLLAELLASCPKLKLLVTSRAALKLRWEYLFPVPPLALPDPKRLPDLETLRQVPAITLFLKRAGSVRPNFSLSAENAPTVAAICHHLDGLPLAIELAAPRLKLFGPQELLGRLERHLEGSTSHASDLPARQRTLHSEIQWSYDLLSEKEQTLFRRLAVFIGSFSAETVIEICGDTDMDVLEGLGGLVDQSLLRVEPEEEETRFRMLETLREFALARLEEHQQEKAKAEERHGFCYLRFLREQGVALGRLEQGQALGALEKDLGNVRQAWAWAVETAQVQEISEGAATLCMFHDMDGRYWEGIASFEKALDGLGDATDLVTLGCLLAAQSWLYKGLGDYEQAAELAERSLQLLRPHGAGWSVVTALSALAYALFSEGRFEDARQRWEEALALDHARPEGVATATANLTAHLGMTQVWLGNYGDAERYLLEALELARRSGDRVTEVFALLNLGNAQTYGGRLQAGRATYEEGLHVAREVSNRRSIPHLLYCSGWLARSLGNFVEARDLCEEAVALAQESGDAHAECFALMNLGGALVALRDLSGAEYALIGSLRAAWKTRSTALIAPLLIPLGEVRLLQGRQEEAAELLHLGSRHPAVWAWLKVRATQMLNTSIQLPSGVLQRVLQRGDPKRLEDVVSALLGNHPGESMPSPLPVPSMPPQQVSLEPSIMKLSRRETQVLEGIAEGLTNKGIAKCLGISEKTVARHLENIFGKLGVSSRAAATALAIRSGFLSDSK